MSSNAVENNANNCQSTLQDPDCLVYNKRYVRPVMEKLANNPKLSGFFPEVLRAHGKSATRIDLWHKRWPILMFTVTTFPDCIRAVTNHICGDTMYEYIIRKTGNVQRQLKTAFNQVLVATLTNYQNATDKNLVCTTTYKPNHVTLAGYPFRPVRSNNPAPAATVQHPPQPGGPQPATKHLGEER